jgi:hypothetical protein
MRKMLALLQAFAALRELPLVLHRPLLSAWEVLVAILGITTCSQPLLPPEAETPIPAKAPPVEGILLLRV